jgi:hypothetical protein
MSILDELEQVTSVKTQSPAVQPTQPEIEPYVTAADNAGTETLEALKKAIQDSQGVDTTPVILTINLTNTRKPEVQFTGRWNGMLANMAKVLIRKGYLEYQKQERIKLLGGKSNE